MYRHNIIIIWKMSVHDTAFVKCTVDAPENKRRAEESSSCYNVSTPH